MRSTQAGRDSHQDICMFPDLPVCPCRCTSRPHLETDWRVWESWESRCAPENFGSNFYRPVHRLLIPPPVHPTAHAQVNIFCPWLHNDSPPHFAFLHSSISAYVKACIFPRSDRIFAGYVRVYAVAGAKQRGREREREREREKKRVSACEMTNLCRDLPMCPSSRPKPVYRGNQERKYKSRGPLFVLGHCMCLVHLQNPHRHRIMINKRIIGLLCQRRILKSQTNKNNAFPHCHDKVYVCRQINNSKKLFD